MRVFHWCRHLPDVVILAQPESLTLSVLLFVIPAGNLLLFWLVILTLSEVEGEESPHLLMLLPVILAQPESPSLSVLLFVIPAGNLLPFWLVILSAAKNPRICFCCCPSFWRSQNLRRCLFFCLSFPQGICFCRCLFSFVILSFARNLSRCPCPFLTYNSQRKTFLSRVSTLQNPCNSHHTNHLPTKNTWHTR